ncbi:MAG: hypothetical protein JKY37_22970 [Nannocystaceae bacterium]|nr:hypothetical protein [Nannocystaceae bacterium]
MQLLVYARNHTPADGGADEDMAQARTFVGLAIGESPRVAMEGDFGTSEGPTSFVEVRLEAHTIDLLTAVPLLIAKAIAREPRANRRPTTVSCSEGVVRLKLEPGFANAKQVCAPLLPLLERCRVYGDTLTTSMANAAGRTTAELRPQATPTVAGMPAELDAPLRR